MLCPWCMHCGSEDEEYVFDSEGYCGICAQSMPRDDETWRRAFAASDPAWLVFIEQELNRIGASKSGLRPELRDALPLAVDAFAQRRLHGDGPLSEDDYALWYRFACTYYAPNVG